MTTQTQNSYLAALCSKYKGLLDLHNYMFLEIIHIQLTITTSKKVYWFANIRKKTEWSSVPEDTCKKAIIAILGGKMSIRKAAVEYNITKSTLLNRVHEVQKIQLYIENIAQLIILSEVVTTHI